jgi:predicted esterase
MSSRQSALPLRPSYNGTMARVVCFLLVAASLLLSEQAKAAQSPSEVEEALRNILNRARPGTVTEHITSVSDPSQSYAVYLPSAYRYDKMWPVLLLLDPRGRARVPIDLFIEGAERYGYVLVSSYNTASDTPEDVNTPALQAMLNDVTRLFSLDTKRLYLAGFSGTARMTWYYATQLEQHTAGIIGFCGGLPQDFRLPKKARYAFFGASGTTDFNYEEMRALDKELDKREIIHRFVTFEGRHQWGPAEVCDRALEWMELQAMKSGIRIKNDDLIALIYRQRASEAASEIDPLAAFTRYRALVDDFDGLVDSDEFRIKAQKVRELEKLDTVKDSIKRQERLSRRHRNYEAELSAFFRDVNDGEQDLALPRTIRRLQLRELKKQAEDTSSPAEALAAQRMLEVAYVDLAYYQARRYMEKEPSRAIAFLELADFIHPDNFYNLRELARAYAQRKDVGRTVEFLRRAHSIQQIDVDQIATDRYFERIRNEPEFKKFVDSLRQP